MGALTIIAIRKAIEDAGISPSEIDGIVLTAGVDDGDLERPEHAAAAGLGQHFKMVDYPQAGITRGDIDWVLLNMPELTNVKFKMNGPICMSVSFTAAAEAVARASPRPAWWCAAGTTSPGATTSARAPARWTPRGPGQVRRHLGHAGLRDHGDGLRGVLPEVRQEPRHDGPLRRRRAPQRPDESGRLLHPAPAGDDHRGGLSHGRWIAKPANIYDNDLPIQAALAVVFTTPERAKDHKPKPAYILSHGQTRPELQGVQPTLEQWERATDRMGRILYEGAGIGPDDLSFENMYDGFTLFHQFHLEGLRFAARGEKRGYALDLYQTDISIEGPNPVSPSGGNSGNGRTRWWNHRDSILQVQGRSPSQIKRTAEFGVSGAPMPDACDALIWSANPPV